MSNVVIIGAGRTGRGYIARQISTRENSLVFIDKNEELVRNLREQRELEISYYGNSSKKTKITGYQAYQSDTEDAKNAIARADYIFTSVGEQNLIGVGKLIKSTLKMRDLNKKQRIITGENGISPKQKLLEVLTEKEYEISEAIIFCTTNPKNKIDILSEELDFLPYDIVPLSSELPFCNFVAEEKFHDLLQRKIYTYNCLSACISYLGDCMGYENYGQAANDPFILDIMTKLKNQLTKALSKKYSIEEEEQDHFGNMAIKKFTNMEIEDSVVRNARNARRKLGPEERILAPLKILQENGQDTTILCLMAAAAMCFGCKKENMDIKQIKFMVNENAKKRNIENVEKIIQYFDELMNSKNKGQYLKKYSL